MSFPKKFTLTGTTASDGSLTCYSTSANGPAYAFGRVIAVVYTFDDFDAGSTMTLSTEGTGQTIWTEANVDATAIRYPRLQVHSSAGVARTYNGTQPVCVAPMVCHERLKMIVASGGDSKKGTWDVYVD